jgi:hypothetical protein
MAEAAAESHRVVEVVADNRRMAEAVVGSASFSLRQVVVTMVPATLS